MDLENRTFNSLIHHFKYLWYARVGISKDQWYSVPMLKELPKLNEVFGWRSEWLTWAYGPVRSMADQWNTHLVLDKNTV